MASVAMPFPSWSADYHKTMAAVSTVGAKIKKHASIFQIATNVWSIDKAFKALLSDLREIKAAPREELVDLTKKLVELQSSMNKVLVCAKSQGLTNRTLTAGSFRSLGKQQEILEDLIETFSLSADESIHQLIQEGWNEYRDSSVTEESLAR